MKKYLILLLTLVFPIFYTVGIENLFQPSSTLHNVDLLSGKLCDHKFEDGKKKVVIETFDRGIHQGKVKSLNISSKQNSSSSPLYRFEYFSNHTEVYDALDHKMVYRFSPKQGVITGIEKYDQQRLVYQEKYDWQVEKNGKLTLFSQSILNELQEIILHRTFSYTTAGEVASITLYGNLSGKSKSPISLDAHGKPSGKQESYSIFYEYTEHDPSLLIREREQNGKNILYLYTPGTQRLEGILVCDQETIIKRTFYSYNALNQLVEIIEDDGNSLRSSDLSTVKQRTIKRQTFKDRNSLPDHPLSIEQITVDRATKGEKSEEKRLFEYFPSGEIQRTGCYDASGTCLESTEFTYNSEGLPIRSLDLNGNQIEKTYDLNGNCIFLTLTQADGKIFQTYSAYDFFNRLIQEEEIDSGGRKSTKRYLYDLCGNKCMETDSYGNETFFEYDALGRMTKVILPALLDQQDQATHPILTKVYDLFNRITLSINSEGGRTETSYTVRGQPTEIVYPDGTKEIFEYHLDGSLAKSVSKNGAYTLFTTNCEGQPTHIQLFSADHQLLRTIDLDYSGFHLISTTDSVDGKNNLIEESPHDFQNPNHDLKNSSSFLYSEDSIILNDRAQFVRQKTVVDEQGHTSITLYDALGHVESVTQKNPFGEATRQIAIRWNGSGCKTLEKHAIFSSTGNYEYVISWKYGPGGNVIEQIEGVDSEDPRTTFYTYNLAGLIASCTKPDGVTLNYEYNSFGDLSKLWDSIASFCYLYTYDAFCHVVKVEERIHGNLIEREYDKDGNMISESVDRCRKIEKVFDQYKRCTQLTFPDLSSVAYQYENNRLSAIRRTSPEHEYTHRYVYTEQGQIASSTLVADVGCLSNTYDERKRLIGITSPFWSESIHYANEEDQIGSIDFIDKDGAFTDKFRHDQEGRLIGENSHSFAYDSIGNRTVSEAGNWTYDAHQQLTHGPNTCYQHDRNGNLIRKTTTKDEILYEYDPLDRLIRVIHPNKQLIKYTYDAFNRRISKTFFVWNTDTSTWTMDGSQYFLYDGEKEIGSLDQHGHIKELRILGNGLGAEIGSAVAIELNNFLFVPIHDHRGSVCCLIDAKNRRVANCFRFNAFGEEINNSIHSYPMNPWRFCSKRFDEESGLVNFGKRYYDPEVGRWITQDPLGFTEGINRYQYVSNNPLSRLDLYGLFSFSAFWQNFSSTACSAYNSFSQAVNSMDRFITQHLSFSTYARDDIQQTAELFFRKSMLAMVGFYPSTPKTGVYGSGEVNDKVRITMINGILNIHDHFLGAAAMISDTHGSNNVHYVFRPTEGWAWDLLKSFATKLGYIPPQAHQLADTWKTMIEEMGGIEGGGIIYHYAHSIGGTDTLAAKRLLSPEEQKMICVITFGSATMVADKDFKTVTNFISFRDGVCMLDPLGYFKGCIGFQENVVFIGSIWGVPIIDHAFGSTTYRTIIEALGQQFIKMYFE